MIDEDGDTPLHCAAYSGDITIIQELIEHNADIKAINENDDTPYDIAVSNCYIDDIIELLDSKDNIVENSLDYKNELVKKFTCKLCNINEIKVVLGCGHMTCKSCSKGSSKCNICDSICNYYVPNKIKLQF
jgi:ankyrin repeat protein